MSITPFKPNSANNDEKQVSNEDIILRDIKNERKKCANAHHLPYVYKSEIPFRWINPVYGVSRRQVRESSGLDAYFFLCYI